jgi:hypothetical protein
MLCVAEFVGGVWFVTKGTHPKGFRPTMLAVGGFIAALSFVIMVRNQVFQTQLRDVRGLGSSASMSQLYRSIVPFSILEFVVWGVQSGCTVAIAIVAIVMGAKTRKGDHTSIHKTVSKMMEEPTTQKLTLYQLAKKLIIASSFLLILGIWWFPFVRMWGGMSFINSILNGWISFLILVLVYIPASKTTVGLSSSQATDEKVIGDMETVHSD